MVVEFPESWTVVAHLEVSPVACHSSIRTRRRRSVIGIFSKSLTAYGLAEVPPQTAGPWGQVRNGRVNLHPIATFQL
jgi:hypothetical protein